MQRFPLNHSSLHTQTHTTPNLEPYKIVCPLCDTSPHKMHNPSARCITLLLCLTQTIHQNWNLTRLHNTQCLKTLFKHYTTKSWCKNELQLQESIMQQLKQCKTKKRVTYLFTMTIAMKIPIKWMLCSLQKWESMMNFVKLWSLFLTSRFLSKKLSSKSLECDTKAFCSKSY